MKTNKLYCFIFILFASCVFNDYTPQKDETKKQYDSFLQANKKELEIIATQCYKLKIKTIKSDSLLKIIQIDSLKKVIDNISYLDLINLPDYIAYDFKLKIKENKCVDFFLTRLYFSQKKDSSWTVKVIDKSPCF